MTATVPTRDPALARLPLELIPHIFNQLDPLQDKVALAKCALIAPCFQTAAQAQLFSSVTLFYVTGYDKEYKLAAMDMPQGIKFLRSITESRHLANLVRSLHIQLSDNTVASSNMKAAANPTFSSLNAILNTLTGLEVFSMDSNRSIYWGTLSNAHKSSIVTMLRSNRTQELRILCMSHFPRSLCCYSSTLRDLTISNIDEQSDAIDDDAQTPHSIALKSLTIGWSAYGTGIVSPITKFLGSSACPLDISSLVALNIATSYSDSWDICPILNLCSNTLRCLTMKVPEGANNKPSYPIVDLQSLHNLSELYLTGSVTSRWLGSHRNPIEATLSPVTWIGLVLRTLPFDHITSKCSDTYVQIDLELVQVTPASITTVPWGDLVAGILAHSNLRKKVVNLSFNDYFLPQYAEPHGPGIFEERIRVLKDDVNLRRLGNDVVFDFTERFTTYRKHPS